jgi:hypothetical protein
MQKTTLLILMCLANFFVQAQLDFTPYPGNNTVCPEQSTYYTVIPPNNSCGTYTWTVTNGRFFNNVSTGTTVSVLWNDEPKFGKLKVTTTCGGTAYTAEKEYVIRSIKNETPANPRAYQVLPFCSTASINVAVDQMTIKNTGGVSPVSLQYVDGFEWVLPAGWKMNGVGGTVYTTSEFVSIQPDHGCSGGVITVRGFIDSPCNPSFSNAATISVNRASTSIAVTPPSGYIGPRCGATNPVTFTATSVGCASNYVWTFPSGWRGPGNSVSPDTTIGNSITLTPSGADSDNGTITVSVHLDCGTNLPGSYSANYVAPNPIVSGASAVCTSGTTFTVANAPTGSVATWSSSANISINSSTGFATATGGGTGLITLSLSTPCGIFTRTKSVWVGPPTATALNLAVMFGPSENQLCWNMELGIGVTNSNHATQSVTGYSWNFSSWSGYHTGYDVSPYGSQGIATFIVNSTTPTPRLMSVRAQNLCGLSPQYWESFSAIDCQGGGPGPMMATAYPVPTNEYLTITLDTSSGSEASVKLYNSFSHQVFETKSSAEKVTIPVKDLPEGTYYLHVKNGKRTEKQRILIKH